MRSQISLRFSFITLVLTLCLLSVSVYFLDHSTTQVDSQLLALDAPRPSLYSTPVDTTLHHKKSQRETEGRRINIRATNVKNNRTQTQRENATAEVAHDELQQRPDAPPLNEEERVLASRAATQQRRNGLVEVLEAEPRDDAWAAEVESTIVYLTDSLDETLFAGTTVEHAECRSTMCRVEVRHATQDARDALPDELDLEDFPRIVGLRVPDDNGELGWTLFMARNGSDIPDIDTSEY